MEKTIFLNKNIDVLVVSAGGVGTTFLMNAIAKYKITNCPSNTDGYKHLPIPPIISNRNLKIVYVFGDPILACISLFRRKFHHTQSVWANKFQQLDYTIPKNITLEEYVENRKDGHYFQLHLNNWKKEYLYHQTLFLKYESIYDSLENLRSFLSLPASFVEEFPKKLERQSSITRLSDTTLAGLQEMYETHQKQLGELPSFSIITPVTSNSIYKNVLKKPYVKAFIDASYKSMPFIRKMKNTIIGFKKQ